MISLKYDLPLIRGAEGHAVAFDSGWLRVALHRAARKAGYHGWLLADDLVAGISLYLKYCYLKNVIDIPELESTVRTALHDIGYGEVARCFGAVSPFQCVSLMQCLRNAPGNRRATFFTKLDETIAALYEAKVRHFHFCDLRACVDKLHEDDAFTASGNDGLRAKIVAFVRERVQSRGSQQEIWCSIS